MHMHSLRIGGYAYVTCVTVILRENTESRGVSRRTPGSPGFNVIFSCMVFPRVFLRKNYEKQVILAEKKVLGFNITHFLATPLESLHRDGERTPRPIRAYSYNQPSIRNDLLINPKVRHG